MELNLMKKAAVFYAVFAVAAMGMIIALSLQKPARASEMALEPAGNASGEGMPEAPEEETGKDRSRQEEQAAQNVLTGEKAQNVQNGGKDLLSGGLEAGQGSGQEQTGSLAFGQEGSDTSYLRIPLPPGCSAENVVIENYYMDQELCVLISGVTEDFYADHAISGNHEMVREGTYEADENSVRLQFLLEGIFEYRTILEDSDLYISFVSPREMYDKIVVIDPACGGFNSGYKTEDFVEKDVNLQIARKLKKMLDETDVKVYYTRVDDVNPQEENRIRLANEVRADMYIRIQMDTSQDSAVYGTTAVYNGDYFIPGFGSVELADLLEREVVTSIKGKALGLQEAENSEYAIRHVTVPAAALKAGCATNRQEASLLTRDEYQEKIAAGIYNAIMKAYE